MPRQINGQTFYSEAELAKRLGCKVVKTGSFGVFCTGGRSELESKFKAWADLLNEIIDDMEKLPHAGEPCFCEKHDRETIKFVQEGPSSCFDEITRKCINCGGDVDE